MKELINKFRRFNKEHLKVVGVISLLLLAVFLLWFGNYTSMQSDLTMRIELYFEGEYRIADGPWQEYVPGQHIPATQGDVTLRGNLYKRCEGEDLGIYNEEDLPAAFYTNHINLLFCEIDENGEKVYFHIENENPMYGSSNCGETWYIPKLVQNSNQPMEILINNPHEFGNETAIDEMLSTMVIVMGIEFEKGVLDSGATERNVGLLFIICSFILLGIALFSSLTHVKNNVIIWLTGLVALFAGLHFAYSADGVSHWSESVVSNTTLVGLSMMFYMFFILACITFFLKKTQMVGTIVTSLMAVVNAICFIAPMVSSVLFYDTWIWWIIAQIVVNVVLFVCLVMEFVAALAKERWIYFASILPLLAFAIDVVGVWLGFWSGAVVSKYLFIILFAIAAILVLKLVPSNINAAAKAKELEMEKIMLNAQLAESRISTMMSQIRPHFIYNTLGSIEQLCKFDPPKAGDLVHNFAKYLRGNFGELDNPKPILMSQEMEHVHHYISIENVRFPDMTFTFEMNCNDFHIPALTVQPIVENAIKHGLMKLPKGGTIRVVSYETDSDYCISVEDDGVGFDTGALLDDRKHVGLRNIRERLKVMVNGTLEINSTIGVGTKVVVKIPKEGRV